MEQHEQDALSTIQLIDVLMDEADTACGDLATAREELEDVRMLRYERATSESGEEMFTPLKAIMADLTTLEMESSRFQDYLDDRIKRGLPVKANGKSTKDERQAEIDTYMATIPEWAALQNRLRLSEVKEGMAKAAFDGAEKNYGRLHTKIMALRGRVEYMTAWTNDATRKKQIEAARIEQETQHLTRKYQDTAQNIAVLECRRAELDQSTAEFKQQQAVVEVREQAAQELAQYKAAVAPLLLFAETLKALNLNSLGE